MLVVDGDQGAIGYNSAHARVRQRFTIAHELAHYVLHARRSGKAQLFIDNQVTYRRDDQSSAGVNPEEIEANQLGAALLRSIWPIKIRCISLALAPSQQTSQWSRERLRSARHS